MARSYLVTGVSGHLGNAIVRQLLEDGETVRGLVLPGEVTAGKLPEGMELFQGDITDRESLRPFFAAPKGTTQRVIHCAGIISIASKAQAKMRDTNVGGVQSIIALAKEYQVEKLVYVSSVHAIPEQPHGEVITEVRHFHPSLVVGPYAKTKAEATALVLEAAKGGLDASVVHPSGIVGPFDYGQGHTTQLILDFSMGRLWAAVKGGYDFVDVRDVARGTIAASKVGKRGECYILSGHYVTIRQFLDAISLVIGRPKVKVLLPRWFAKLTAPLAELYYALLKQPPLFSSYSLYTLGSNGRFSHVKANTELGYTTRAFEETIQAAVFWLRSEGRLFTG